MASRAVNVLSGLGQKRDNLERLYKRLHSHPELSHQEQATAALVRDRLRAAGFDVHSEIGTTGVVGVLANGDGPCVLLRADMDALPVREETGLDYASEVMGVQDGEQVPVMHACGHDVHVTSLVGAAELMAEATADWSGTLITLFQPAEEVADGAQRMVDDGLADLIPKPDVALAQHVLVFPAGDVGTRVGAVLSAGDSLRITVYGRGAHGSRPQAGVDPVLLASAVVLRLHTIVSREIAVGDSAVLTVGSIHAGSASNVIPDSAQLLVNIRTYDERVRETVLKALERIVKGECEAAGSPRDPEIERYQSYPLTTNDPAVTERVAAAFEGYFGEHAVELPVQSASEDFTAIPDGFGIPYTYWGIGGTDRGEYETAAANGTVAQDIPVNHNAGFAPVVQPTLDTGVSALVVAALAWLDAEATPEG